MDLRDLIVTPLLLMLVYFLAYLIRPRVTNSVTRVYFFPALTMKIIGALSMGIIYQFYYGGGDTFNYSTEGSRLIWEAFIKNPTTGLKLIFYPTYPIPPDTFRVASKILFYSDPSSYFVIRIAAFFDLLTFSTYSATAVLFSLLSFIGSWLFFLTFYRQYPDLHRRIAIASFFIPSVFFWGSGILKDTIIVACLGATTYQIKKIFIDRNFGMMSLFYLTISLLLIYLIKIYVLLCFLPAALLWIYASNLYQIKSAMLRIMILPLVLAITALSGYYAVVKVGENDKRYAIDKLARTARVTAYDIGFYTGRNAGSGYSLGELDDSFTSLLKLAPQAINVSLFRPYLWEVKNPLMALSALESMLLFFITSYLVLFRFRDLVRSIKKPNILFCLVFSITFAFAVGVSTFNFGTLGRYKIPLLPYYAIAIVLILDTMKTKSRQPVAEQTPHVVSSKF